MSYSSAPRDETWRGWAEGEPAPQGSKSVSRAGRTYETNKRTMPWRRHLHATWAPTAPPVPLDGPIAVRMTFYQTRPRTVRRQAPTVPPDVDKLCRAVADSLTQARVIVDDSRIVDLHATKAYTTEGQPPGVLVQIWTMR